MPTPTRLAIPIIPPKPAKMNCFTCVSFRRLPFGCSNRFAYPVLLSDGSLACTRYEQKLADQPKDTP